MTRRGNIVEILGDSTCQGLNNSDPTTSWADMAAQAAGCLYVKFARGTERGINATRQEREPLRLLLSEGCTHTLWCHGVNDYRTTTMTPREMAVNALIVASRRAERGRRVHIATLVPNTTTTDAWRTAANQTIHAQDFWRQEYHRWVRGGAPLAIARLSAPTALDAATWPVDDTSAFPTMGLFVANGVPIEYRGKTATSFTNCRAPVIAGSQHLHWPPRSAVTVAAGAAVLGPPWWVVGIAGSGQTLPLATVTVDDATPFAAAGTIYVGGQRNMYTAVTAASFTGVANFGRNIAVGGAAILQVIDPAGPTISYGQTGHPLAGYVEVADAVEESRSGKWKVDGSTANLYTNDGTHQTGFGHAAIASFAESGHADAASYFAALA